ncbi:MAG: hypothetical protein EP330_23825 [Deltaproteobacteria bacterium]|nr:MAG: hypothetical protein EP330_23825 [Deltaproteobacteria bacterium]
MRRAAVVAAIALFVAGGAALALRPGSEQTVAIEPVPVTVAPAAAPVHDHDHGPASGERRGPNGMPIPDDAPTKTAGWDETPRQPALNDAEAWVGERAEAHREWVESTGEALDIYADREELTPHEFAALHASITTMQDSIAATRQAIESGELAPIHGRQDITAARELCSAEVEEILGPDEAEAFRLEMMKRVRGGLL